MKKMFLITIILAITFLYVIQCKNGTDPEPQKFKVSITSPNNGSVDNTGDVTVTEGEDLTLTATPSTGYHFHKWVTTGGISVTDNSATGKFKVSGEGTVKAVFVTDKCQDFIPPANGVSGWGIDNSGTCFDGYSDDSDGLYGIIDGGADIYIDNGYTEASFKGYTDNSTAESIICVRVYNQGSKKGAVDVYTHESLIGGTYIDVENIADSTRLDDSYPGSYTLEMVYDQYYIYLSSMMKNDAIKAELIKMAKYMIENN